MRYYIDDKSKNKKVYLRLNNVRTREELYKKLNSTTVKVAGHTYTINEINAVSSVQVKSWRDLLSRKVSVSEENSVKMFNKSKINTER